ncbi:4a-hydroxytetrahydrobiopterin dehydratase [Sessilibacter sp. MAH2]
MGDNPLLTEQQIQQQLQLLSGWNLETKDKVSQLVKQYSFSDFQGATAAAQILANLADAFDHHPKLIVEWGSLTVIWWTHSVAGLTQRDIDMASKTDQQLMTA